MRYDIRDKRFRYGKQMQQEGVAGSMSQDNLILDRYEPIGTAGAGGFGTVQIAWDPRIQRKVAIKTIQLTAQDAYRAALPGARAVKTHAASPTADRWHGVEPWDEYLASTEDEQHDAGGPSQLEEIDQVTSLAHLPGLDEARTAAMLSDPRIVTVYDFEVRGRFAYLIMEYVEGITLTKLLADYEDHLTLDMVVAVFDAIAGALSTAHNAGVLHLDIKPDNIIINPHGQAKVTDFGLATLADASGFGTTGGGTIGYMPLEQLRREHLDARTDEWSLASLTYEMLTGDNPFRAPNLEAAERAIEDAELVLPSLCWDNLDDQIDDVVFYALDPDREERYETVADFAEEVDKFLGDPEKGRDQLALVVSDALGLPENGEEDEEPPWDEGADGASAGSKRPRPKPFLWLHDMLESDRGGEEDEFEADEPYYAGRNNDYDEGESVPSRKRGPSYDAHGRVLSERMNAPLPARLLAGLGAGFSAAFAAFNFPLVNMLGSGAIVAVAIVTAGVAALGIAFPSVGALVALCLIAVIVAVCGNPVIGAVFGIAVVVWWYAIGHEGKAPSNVALLAPPLGAVGASSIVPFVSGAALPPLHALATSALSVLCSIVLGAFGSCSVLGWDAFSFWSIPNVDYLANILAIVTQPATWTTIAGWLLATLVISVAFQRGSRALALLAIAVAVAFVLLGGLVFAAPSVQLIAPVALAAVALVVAKVLWA